MMVDTLRESTLQLLGTIVLFADAIEAAHVGPQDLGDDDASVCLLIVFKHRDQRAADGQAGTVQGMHQFGFIVAPAFEADGGPAGLKILEIAAR